MKTIFLIQPKTGNIGNQIIAAGMEQLLRQAFDGKANLISLPADGTARGGLDSKGIYEINRLADGLIIGPGNLFENGALHCEVEALSSLSVPTMLFSVSTAQIYDRSGVFANRTDALSRAKIKAVCQASNFVLVRDEASQAYLEKLEVPGVRVVGCPSIALSAESLPLPPPDPMALGAVLISVRHPMLMSVPYSLHAKVRADLRRLIDLARQRGQHDVKLLCHDRADLSFAAEFPDVPMLYTENVSRFLGWLRDCQMNLTFRLHSFIPAKSMGKPALHFSYDQRALNLVRTLGLSPWDTDFVNTTDLISVVKERWDSYSEGMVSPSPYLPIWTKLKQAMTEEMAAFAELVSKHSSGYKF